MNNADKFKQIFDLYATELWAMSEKDFLAWLNAESYFPDTNVGDLISRQALKNALTNWQMEYAEKGKDVERFETLGAVIELVERLPTIDAVPVVRCKECKHSEHWYKDKRRCFLWHEVGIGVFEDGFCNYAERKEDE